MDLFLFDSLDLQLYIFTGQSIGKFLILSVVDLFNRNIALTWKQGDNLGKTTFLFGLLSLPKDYLYKESLFYKDSVHSQSVSGQQKQFVDWLQWVFPEHACWSFSPPQKLFRCRSNGLSTGILIPYILAHGHCQWKDKQNWSQPNTIAVIAIKLILWVCLITSISLWILTICVEQGIASILWYWGQFLGAECVEIRRLLDFEGID